MSCLETFRKDADVMSKAKQVNASLDRKNLSLGISLIAGLALVVGAGSGYAFGRQNVDHGDDMADMARAPLSMPGGELRQSVHEHSDFAVFVDGRQIDFNSEQFLSTETNERSPNVHVHAPRTNVAHLHREQTTFDEFFRSLGMELRDDCLKLATGEKLCSDTTNQLRFMVNGVQVDKLMFEKMTDMGRVLISYGPREADLQTQWAAVSDEACIPGENCAARLPEGGIEKEPCAKSAGTCH